MGKTGVGPPPCCVNLDKTHLTPMKSMNLTNSMITDREINKQTLTQYMMNKSTVPTKQEKINPGRSLVF